MDEEHDLRWTYSKRILKGKDEPEKNAVLICISNYPGNDILSICDIYSKELRPPYEIYDDYINTGDPKVKGSGWHSTGFPSKYLVYLREDDEAYHQCKVIKSKSKVRPMYICDSASDEKYSPASVLISFIRDGAELEEERW